MCDIYVYIICMPVPLCPGNSGYYEIWPRPLYPMPSLVKSWVTSIGRPVTKSVSLGGGPCAMASVGAAQAEEREGKGTSSRCKRWVSIAVFENANNLEGWWLDGILNLLIFWSAIDRFMTCMTCCDAAKLSPNWVRSEEVNKLDPHNLLFNLLFACSWHPALTFFWLLSITWLFGKVLLQRMTSKRAWQLGNLRLPSDGPLGPVRSRRPAELRQLPHTNQVSATSAFERAVLYITKRVRHAFTLSVTGLAFSNCC